MTNFFNQIMTAIDSNLEDYRKARKAFAHEYATSRANCLSVEKSAQRACSIAIELDETLGAQELTRWAIRCERTYLENFNNSIFEDSPTVAVIKCLD